MADDVKRITLDGELTIYRAADLKVLVLDALRKARVLEIDLSGVTELDTADPRPAADPAAIKAGEMLSLTHRSLRVLRRA